MQIGLVKDYDYEILYHQCKANVVANTLSYMVTSDLIRDVFFKMIVVTPILEMIKRVWTDVIKDDNRKSERVVGRFRIERIVGQVSNFDINSLGLLTLHGNIQSHYSSEALQTLMDEAQKSNISIHPWATKMYKDLRHNCWQPYMK